MGNVVLSVLGRLPQPWLAFLVCLSLLPFMVLAYDGNDLLRVAVLAMAIFLLLWRSHSRRAVKVFQISSAGLLALLFLVDGVARGFILHIFGAAADSTMVTSALANTHPSEASEFLKTYWPRALPWNLAFLVALLVLTLLLWVWWRQDAYPAPVGKVMRVTLAALLLLVTLAVAVKPWRHFHPLVFWPNYLADVSALSQKWGSLHEQRAGLTAHAQNQAPALTDASPDTLVLVLADSINRNHLSIYGYSRPTTPKLEARRAAEDGRLQVFSHAWSADASTIPALEKFFYFGEPSDAQRSHLLSIASAAGYKTWWISNHDDRAVFQEHAMHSAHIHALNHAPGRTTPAMDHQVLPALEEALRDASDRKLIVVHLLGAHPHYSKRYPKDQDAFEGTKDTVYQTMKDEGRSFWTRKLRNEYDSALKFHDGVVDATLELTQRLGQSAAWAYLSDHGQDVGGMSDHVGHSALSADGYRIPLMIWSNQLQPWPTEHQGLPVRSDWLGHSLIRLLGLSWKGYRPERDVINPGYQWSPPERLISIDDLS